ncbi:hypothetical protein BC828DRAFT_408119 [Blastocladiella britannica]|nr:hypothetical protein BC828DRAFT_408119 [Blastocladiella britannica]
MQTPGRPNLAAAASLAQQFSAFSVGADDATAPSSQPKPMAAAPPPMPPRPSAAAASPLPARAVAAASTSSPGSLRTQLSRSATALSTFSAVSATSATSGASSFGSPASARPFSLLIRAYPAREIAIVTNIDHAGGAATADTEVTLFLKVASDAAPGPNRVVLDARVVPAGELDLAQYTARAPMTVLGLLGVLYVGDDVYLGAVTGAETVAEIDGTLIRRVTDVEFISLSKDTFDRSPAAPRTAYDDWDASGSGATPLGSTMGSNPVLVHPCDPHLRILCGGTFYFAHGNGLDLSRTTQYLATTPDAQPDPQFVWNWHMMRDLGQVVKAAEAIGDVKGAFLVNVIQGYVGKSIAGPTSLALISRMSTARAGTRYATRGIDDAGAVANFVETEMIYTTANQRCAFVQVRGSVPVFWDQPGIQVVGHKVVVTRSRDATRPAFDRHLQSLRNKYGRVTGINLVDGAGLSGAAASGEAVLGIEYRVQWDASEREQALGQRLVDFDFHAECKGNNYGALARLVNMVEDDLLHGMCFLVDIGNSMVIMQQTGIFRVNCVDCLDRTNVVQGMLAEHALNHFVQGLPSYMQEEFKELWANNGDAISRIYAGTGALKSGFTRSGKRTLGGLLDDASKSVGRFVINNFQDKSRQDTIDALLGKTSSPKIDIRDPLLEAVKRDLHDRADEYTSQVQLTIHVGTYNVNGKLPQEPIETWLRADALPDVHPDIFAIGFQEIVELTAGQIVSADPGKRMLWQEELVKTIRKCHGPDYVLVCDGQLVGAAILIFAKSSLTSAIHSVETSIVKTGLGGMAGNKGGISVSMVVHDTPVCFVTAHFAAGQSAVEDRNRDFATITSGTVFRRGRGITDHDYVFFFGDFNYRVDMENEIVRSLIMQQRIPDLLARDQLTAQRRAGRTFVGFEEAPIAFLPTYKFNNGSNTYDTSEKNRIPAWCDRILWRTRQPGRQQQQQQQQQQEPFKPKLDLLTYARAELLVSDHKPVLAVFRSTVSRIDHPRKAAIYASLFAQRTSRNPFRALMQQQQQTEQATKHVPTGDLLSFDDDTMAGGSSGKPSASAVLGIPGLPPPSSDGQQWWTTPSAHVGPGSGLAAATTGLGNRGGVLGAAGTTNPWITSSSSPSMSMAAAAPLLPTAANPWATFTSASSPSSAPPPAATGSGTTPAGSTNPNWSLLD